MRLTQILVLLSALTILVSVGDTSPVGAASAGGLASAAAKAATKGAGKAAVRPKDVIVSSKQHPQAAAHIYEAQRLGEPTVLTLDRANAAQRRRDALRYTPRNEKSPAGKDRDEYPPAMTREGGSNASVRYIDLGHNRGAGKSIDHQTHDLPDGARIRVLVQ